MMFRLEGLGEMACSASWEELRSLVGGGSMYCERELRISACKAWTYLKAGFYFVPGP